MFSLPQELEATYMIPALRRELAKTLTKCFKLKQSESAEILGINKAAVSQYLHAKRASSIKFPKGFSGEFEKSAARIIANNDAILDEIYRLAKLAKKKGIMCSLCGKYNRGVLALCKSKPRYEK